MSQNPNEGDAHNEGAGALGHEPKPVTAEQPLIDPGESSEEVAAEPSGPVHEPADLHEHAESEDIAQQTEEPPSEHLAAGGFGAPAHTGPWGAEAAAELPAAGAPVRDGDESNDGVEQPEEPSAGPRPEQPGDGGQGSEPSHGEPLPEQAWAPPAQQPGHDQSQPAPTPQGVEQQPQQGGGWGQQPQPGDRSQQGGYGQQPQQQPGDQSQQGAWSQPTQPSFGQQPQQQQAGDQSQQGAWNQPTQPSFGQQPQQPTFGSASGDLGSATAGFGQPPAAPAQQPWDQGSQQPFLGGQPSGPSPYGQQPPQQPSFGAASGGFGQAGGGFQQQGQQPSWGQSQPGQQPSFGQSSQQPQTGQQNPFAPTTQQQPFGQPPFGQQGQPGQPGQSYGAQGQGYGGGGAGQQNPFGAPGQQQPFGPPGHQPQRQQRGNDTGKVVLAVVGGVVLLALIIFGVWFAFRGDDGAAGAAALQLAAPATHDLGSAVGFLVSTT